jgi:hypothetical protein
VAAERKSTKGMRKRNLRIGALNVVMQPRHSRDLYIELFRQAVKDKVAASVRADRQAVIATFWPRPDDPDWFYGQMNTFVDIDVKGPWLDFDKQTTAPPAEVAAEVTIPPRLKPGHMAVRYAFNVREHLLVFDPQAVASVETPKKAPQSYSPAAMQKLLLAILDRVATGLGGQVKVTVCQSQDALESIFNLAVLKKIEIVIDTPPNPDDLGDFDEEIEARMKQQNATKLVVEYESESEEGLQPDATTKALANLAIVNGKVKGRGKNTRGKADRINTAEHPFVKVISWIPRVEDIYSALVRGGKEVVRALKENKGQKVDGSGSDGGASASDGRNPAGVVAGSDGGTGGDGEPPSK